MLSHQMVNFCRRRGVMLGYLVLMLLLCHAAAAARTNARPVMSPTAPGTNWLTLSGNAPTIIARGGYSGVFPESSQFGYQFAATGSLSNVVVHCDLQLTKDGVGICKSGLRLENSTTIAQSFPKQEKTYIVNGQSMRGYFALDFTSDQLFDNVTLVQNVLARPDIFDGVMSISSLDDVRGRRGVLIWLNVQHDIFFKQHNLDIGEYIMATAGARGYDYISSPEIGFLKGLKVDQRKTKVVFRFLDPTDVEPSTNVTYGSLLKDLASIKSFASGILVPKNYIWPVRPNLYLAPSTTLVTDAHKLGLEVYAATFANDISASYNYSYDPTTEYLQFIDNSEFAVDGVFSDFPSTASEAVACLAHTKNNTIPKGIPLIITHNGASGVYAGCTDLAYQKAIDDGANVIDCAVQISKDGVPFCLPSIDLVFDTTATTTFPSLISSIPEIQQGQGIFSFDLTWSEIQSLKPQINSPFAQSGLPRNPAALNQGKYLTFHEFLDFTKNNTLSGIYIDVENAPYLASKKGFSIVDMVSSALKNASYDTQTTQQVFIQSSDSAVLSVFKKNPSYRRVLKITDPTSDTPKPTVHEIKQVADAVAIPKSSVFVYDAEFFTTSYTKVIQEMHAGNISVYVFVQRNEYVTIALDFFSDPMVELVTLFANLSADGVITEFPATITSYFKSPCSNPNANLPYTFMPVDPGKLKGIALPEMQPPTLAPAPILEPADVVDPPLPPVADLLGSSPPAREPAPSASHPATATTSAVCVLIVMLSILSLIY